MDERDVTRLYEEAGGPEVTNRVKENLIWLFLLVLSALGLWGEFLLGWWS